jgi:photosystem II stability/assembly factor-like uncharacterized protein
MYKTTNGGNQWFRTSNGLGVGSNQQVLKVAIDPNDSDILFAGMMAKLTENGDTLTTIQGGLFKSNDAGSSWNRVDLDSPQLTVADVAVDPRNSQIVYSAVSSEYDHTVGETYYGGVYKSTDGGHTWMNHASGFGDLDNLSVVSVAIHPSDSRVLYATTTDDPFHDLSSGRGIFRSIDAGETWTPINEGLGVLYYSVITIDPSHPNRLYAGSSGNGIMRGIVAPPTEILEGFLGAAEAPRGRSSAPLTLDDLRRGQQP